RTHLSWPRLIAQFFEAAFLCILGHAHRPLQTRALHVFFAEQALALRHKLEAISHGARGLVYTEHQLETLQI
ncbi:MAG: hypothetical protein CMH03_03870, partial [Marinovum sp.]|nr:hypothetical protein [Marinovum sp.]